MKEFKKCFECNRVLPISEFTKETRRLDGLAIRCRSCIRKKRASNVNRYLDHVDTEKKCIECGETKNASMFYKQPGCTDGYTNKCIDCIKKYKAEYRAKNRDFLRLQDKKWRDNNKELKRKMDKEYYKNNQDKIKAYRQRKQKELHDKGIVCPISEAKDRDPALWLGVYVAEPLLTAYFGNANKMPITNPGFDYVCSRGYKIDVKSSIISRLDKHGKGGRWKFQGINDIADYFFCIGFDNRDDLNVIKVWLFPKSVVSGIRTITISLSKLKKFEQYELNSESARILCENRKRDLL